MVWQIEEIEKIKNFDLNIYKCYHLKSNAKYIHFDSPDMENVFAILVKTPAEDNSGKSYILEKLS